MQALLTKDTPVGAVLPEVACQFTLAHFKRSDESTIHTDEEAARKEGLSAPVATGPQVAALIFRQLRASFGAGWIEGGRCELTFRRPVRVDDFCVARGVVTANVDVGGTRRVECDVWIENAAGDKVIVGRASAPVDA
ncbi:MAG: MaoC family dehydratase [Proteobacteria bacterium]|nr:MaoC family dehydratase [Pseudomonadota bacterium]